MSYPLCYDNLMKNQKVYMVPVNFGSAFCLCEQVEFPIDRETGGLCAAIDFAESTKSNVYLKNQKTGVLSLVWKSKK